MKFNFCKVIVIVLALLIYPSCNVFKTSDHFEHVVGVAATMETRSVPIPGDSLDDPCIYVHPKNSEKSLIIGTDKSKEKGGLRVYDLDGKEVQFIPDGRMNNVDIRYNFSLGDKKETIITAGNRDKNTIAIYKVSSKDGKLEDIAARDITLDIKVYGSCMYHSKKTDKFYSLINDKNGKMQQWHLFDNGKGKVDAKMVRKFSVKSQTEGCVADDLLGNLFLSEERVGIWRFDAEPDSKEEGVLIAKIGGHLVADVEGLTLYYADDKKGYLIASSQGNNTYLVYERGGNNRYRGRFEIVDGNGLDGTQETDGIDVTGAKLGPKFPYGMFVAQDGKRQKGNQNFKCVPWQEIAKVFNPPLSINTEYDPY